MSDLISRKTRTELRELLVGATIRIIDDEFTAAGVSRDEDYEPPMDGARRGRVEQFYQNMDFTKRKDAEKFLQVCESVARWVGAAKLLRYLERDGFVLEGDRFKPVRGSLAAGLRESATDLDAAHMQRLIDRMNDAVETDPDLAIGTAKELVESVCKTILTERSVAFAKDADIPELVKAARAALQLVPEDIPDSAKGAETIKRVLSNLGQVAQGLAELRALYGTGHGRDGRRKGLATRHARLAAGAASALAQFLFDTHKDRE